MKTLTIDQNQFNNYVASICRDISISDWRPDYIVGVGRGGLSASIMISEYFNVEHVGLDIGLHSFDNTISNCWLSSIAFGDSSKRFNILIVDDINNTGETLNWLVDDWQNSCFPDSADWDLIWNQNVKFAVVVDNVASKFIRNIDFFGIEFYEDPSINVSFPRHQWWQK